MEQIEFWRKCSSCKKPIGYNTIYYECSVSTCTGLRTGYVFCSVGCFEVHLPGARHRSAGAVEKSSPTKAQVEAQAKADELTKTGEPNKSSEPSKNSPFEPRRIIVSQSTGASASSVKPKSSMSNEVLVVVSKMKQYIRDISEMNTSEDVNQILSEKIRTECERAVERARADGRKTVMARDFK